ncbi:MAG: 4a-hydroxytetrahydrobiopterin dehydratase [Candidatus Meridianibacter frigidus]|nr:MAG: 4a-hydroxytetrahydrobiopterin dehydratase [Candidatus Eremiobacteraeota bacterium]
MPDLAARECVPCRGGVPPMDSAAIANLKPQIDSAWSVVARPDPKWGTVTLLKREFSFPDFKGALAAALRIGALAEEQRHHPDLSVGWGKLGVQIWTHKIGGLTESDFIFAAKCDAIVLV